MAYLLFIWFTIEFYDYPLHFIIEWQRKLEEQLEYLVKGVQLQNMLKKKSLRTSGLDEQGVHENIFFCYMKQRVSYSNMSLFGHIFTKYQHIINSRAVCLYSK